MCVLSFTLRTYFPWSFAPKFPCDVKLDPITKKATFSLKILSFINKTIIGLLLYDKIALNIDKSLFIF